VVGGGEGEREARRRAGGAPEIRFTGWQDDAAVARWYRGCRALLFPADEDFGIAPVEAMASGRPVVAYGRGGAVETVGDGEPPRAGSGPVRVTGGVLFPEQTVDSMVEGIRLLESESFDREAIRARAERFDREVFRTRIREAVGAPDGGGIP
jgi:glycosyltransferase involved in cell wall biosynthesis